MLYPRSIPDAELPSHTTFYMHTLRNQVLIAHPPFPPYREGHASVHFVAASCGGLAISYATGIAALSVVALWGIFVWNKFREANPAAKTYLAAAFLFYLLGPFAIARVYNVAA